MAFRMGIQLYSVRDGMEQDFEGTLKKVHELGYTDVELIPRLMILLIIMRKS